MLIYYKMKEKLNHGWYYIAFLGSENNSGSGCYSKPQIVLHYNTAYKRPCLVIFLPKNINIGPDLLELFENVTGPAFMKDSVIVNYIQLRLKYTLPVLMY